jgi:hypothetical protein
MNARPGANAIEAVLCPRHVIAFRELMEAAGGGVPVHPGRRGG